jgi:hypothetical protein
MILAARSCDETAPRLLAVTTISSNPAESLSSSSDCENAGIDIGVISAPANKAQADANDDLCPLSADFDLALILDNIFTP